MTDPPAPPPTRPRNRNLSRSILAWVLLADLGPLAITYPLRRWIPLNTKVLDLHSILPRELIRLVMLVFGTWLAGCMEDRTLQAYGLPLKKIPVARFSEGAALGFAMLSLVLFPLALVGRFHVDSLALAGREAASYAAGWAFAFIALAIVEEFFFRGYLLYQVARRLKFWQAALLMSAVFGAAHLGNPGENVLGILHVAADGLLYCLMLRRTGNLWFGIGFHMAWDWAQTFFYGTLDSGLPGVGHLFNTHFNGPTWLTGGSSGPEGGILAFAATVIAAYIVHRRFPTAMYPDRPA